MSLAVCELPPVYILGDLLGSSPAARAWQALLPILDDAGLRMEPRRFWNTCAARGSTALAGRTIRLVAGRRSIDAHTTLDAPALARIERLTTCRVPRGSLVVTMSPELAVHAKALVPEGAGLRLLRPSAVLDDPLAFATRLLEELAGEDSGISTFGASSSRNVVLTAPVLGPSGYAAEGRELFLALERDPRICVSLRPLRFGALPCDEDPEFLEAVRTASERTPSGDYDAIHLVFPRQFRPDPAARTNILRTMFETDAVPATWAPHLQEADELWVPSAFHLRSFGRVYPESRIRCVPEFVSREFLAVPQRRREGATRFLSIFDWSTRKAPELLLRTFGATFSAGEAELWLLMSSSLGIPAEELETRARALLRRGADDAGHAAPDLRLLQGGLAPSAMPRVYAEMDAFVLASRGEGWGRPIHEAMASGLPVIATAFGGCADLLGGTGVAHIIDGRVVPVGDDSVEENTALTPSRDTGSPDGQHRWLEPDPSSIARAMREIHEHPERARDLGARARQHVAREFSELRVDWKRVAKPSVRSRPTIRFEGPLLGSSSYARITRSLASAILDLGMCDIELRESVASPLPGQDPAAFDGMLEQRLAARIVAGDDLMLERPDVCIRSGWPISCTPPHAGRWVQRFDWEYGAIPR
ncbi:MAG: glycosyltransferase, partial [Planctomycetes bacterium]|nr:glycosyltransferase [Planctomycetota bacterium]